MGKISEKIAASMPPPRSGQAQMWDMVAMAIENDTTVTGELLRQRMRLYQHNKDTIGDYADFIESVEAMARGTGKILRDMG